MADDHKQPCADAQVMKSQIEQLFKDRENQNTMFLTMISKMDCMSQTLTELKTETKTRLDYIEQAHRISNDIIDTHVKQSEEYRKKVELCDGFRTSATWGLGVLFVAMVGQFVIAISELFHGK